MILKNDRIKGKKAWRLQGISSYIDIRKALALWCLRLSGPQFACARECVFGCLDVAVGHTGCEVNMISTVSLGRRREPQTPVFGLQGAQFSWPALPGHTRQGSAPRWTPSPALPAAGWWRQSCREAQKTRAHMVKGGCQASQLGDPVPTAPIVHTPKGHLIINEYPTSEWLTFGKFGSNKIVLQHFFPSSMYSSTHSKKTHFKDPQNCVF